MEFNATFIVSAISFIAFTLIMNAIFYKPLGKIVGDRQQFLDENYKEATWAKEKVVSLLSNKQKKLDQSKHEAKKIIADKADSAKQQKAEMTGEAQQVAAVTVNEAKSELHKSNSSAQEVLATQVVDLAQDISSKILGETIGIENVDKSSIDKIMQG